MSEDVEEASEQQITTRSGHSFGVGSVGDSGGLLSAPGARPSASAAHSASSPLVDSHETQLGSEVGLTATTTTESTITSAAMQMNSPVDSPPSAAPREAGSNIGKAYLCYLPKKLFLALNGHCRRRSLFLIDI